MDIRSVAPVAGAVACLLVVIVVALPWLLVEGQSGLVRAYYSAGLVGAGGVGFFALIGIVAFASAERGNVDPVTMAGGLVVLGVAILLFALSWWLAIPETVVFSFSAEYSWIEHHPPAVVLLSLLPQTIAAVYARAVLSE
ncbi:DUF7548 family protein [Haloparvum sp. PAK95]|uniref:DUF7548 family protein n=1 Tax=Haloparvum sp. PAK95 TaxID=3418962 RepID=UPI003D2EF8CE